ncbi:hypothetical protein TSA66_00480 [Noviherbaspirillum autotrophicum]|uniref:Uncharacterized protein n=1 Tax=Noviherbaspirillum autotrophicum TaxID=709839 RepID=A0A0C1YAP1_9BURK|nr:hypothetical protein TSA66_14215 [Noviherbaspirillum autotrophicum]KIF82041.1 hypothetical protein TSA66_16550 [Noviherbaspirillum autotrophicum]KIF84073.1 hypothetical protein TSA66_00480 [Noviherbaspirillum autotrophicum]
MMALAGSTCIAAFLLIGMTAAQLIQRFLFLSHGGAGISCVLFMRLVTQRRMRDVELLRCVGLAARVDMTSRLGRVVSALLIIGLA